MKKQYHIIKMTFMFLLILSVMIVFVNCGKSNKSSDISLSLKAPSYVSTGSYTVTAAAYDKNGTLLGNQVSATITNMEGSLSLTGIPAQSDVSIAVSVKQLNSDTILIRGSKIVNISEGINTVDLTLGLHQLNLSGKYQEITDISSFDNFSVVLWHTWSDTSTYYAEKTKYASKFDEIKGVFTGHYSYATDTNYNEYYSMETAVDSAGNIIIVRKPGSENRIEIYAIPANFSSAVLLCDTTSTDFSNQNYYLLTDKNQNIILTFYYSSLFKQYNLVYNSSSLSANSAVLRYYNSFENSYASESSHSLKYDSNNRLHLTYYYPSSSMNSSSPVEYKWEYSDNYGSSFSQPKTFYSYPGYYPSTVYGSAYIHNFGALIDGALITLKHTSYDDTTCLFYSRILSSGSTPESQLFFTNVATPPTQFNSYYSELKSGNNGKYLFFNLMNKTNNIPYLIIFQDKGDTWSVPIKLFDTAPANYYNNIWDANNYSAKFVMIGKQTCSSQQPAPIKNSITRSPKYSYGYGTILENIYISEQFGSGYFTQASVSTPSSSSNLPPNIYLDSLTGETKGIDQTITCLATDTDGTVSMVYLYYKKNSDKNYTFATINSEISYPSSYHYTISGSFTSTADTIYYYFLAVDNSDSPTYRDSENSRSTLGTTSPLTLVMKQQASTPTGSWVNTYEADYIATNEASSIAMAIYGEAPIFSHSAPNYSIYSFKYNSSLSNWPAGPTRIIGTNSIYNLATAADSSGNLYVAYKQFEGEYFALYVQKYINCSGSASLVGSSYIDMTSTASDKIAIAVNNSGEIFIAYLSDNTTLKVKKFTAGAWYDITANIFSYGSVYSNYLDLDVDSQGNPYIAFQDSSKSNKATVKKYVTEEWFTQGTGSDSAVSATSGGEVSFLDLKICGDTIFLAFADSGDANKPNVMQYTQSGWTRVGSSSAYSAAVSSISLTTYYGKPYIAFIDSSASYSATVRHYNGSSWVTLGSAGITNSDLTLPPVLVINTSGIPFLGYRNGASSNLGNVKKYISY